jgi:hypothetical protein
MAAENAMEGTRMRKLMLVSLAALMALCGGARATSKEAWQIRQPATITAHALGCRQQDIIEHAQGIAHQNREAFRRLVLPAMRAGEYVTFTSDTPATLTDKLGSARLAKARRAAIRTTIGSEPVGNSIATDADTHTGEHVIRSLDRRGASPLAAPAPGPTGSAYH